MKKTKIVATIGPTTANDVMLKKCIILVCQLQD